MNKLRNLLRRIYIEIIVILALIWIYWTKPSREYYIKQERYEYV